MQLKILAFGLGLLLAVGCQESSQGEAGGAAPCPEMASSSSGGDAPLYPNGISPIIGAEITRIGRAADPTQGETYKAITEPLFTSAINSAATPEVEAQRVQYAIDDLTRTYVSTWVEAAEISPSSWLDTLPAGRLLTPEEASYANFRALVLIRGQRVAFGSQAWDAELDGIGQGVHAAVMADVPGLPQAWYGADTAFRVGFEATGYLGAKAGVQSAPEALGLAQQQVGPKVGAAALAAVQAMIDITK